MRPSAPGDLPAPPREKRGWPWTADPSPLTAALPDGAPWPRISMVTPSFNQGDYLEETIRSVLLQGYPNLEYLVIDGGSTDRSVEVIRKYEPWLTDWLSERDDGQTDALCKGLARCTGDIFNWINSDDLLCPGALEAVARAWRGNPGTIIAGPVVDFYPDGTERPVAPRGISIRSLMLELNEWNEGQFCHQPGIFLPLTELREVGGLRRDLHYIMDHEAYVRLLPQCAVSYISEPLARFRMHDRSKTTSSAAKFAYERERVWSSPASAPKGITAAHLRRIVARSQFVAAAYALGEGRVAACARYLARAVRRSPLGVLQEMFGIRLWRGAWRRISPGRRS